MTKRKMHHKENPLEPCKELAKTLLLTLLAFSIMTTCHTTEAQSQERSTYHTLLKSLKEGNRTTDFTMLRLSYTETSDYNPYGQDDALRSAMFTALQEKRYGDAIAEATKILETNFVDLDSHYVCTVAYKRMNDSKSYEFHDYVLQGLLSSILNSGDGKSPETALRVISTAEEYTILGMTGLRSMKQSLVHKNAHHYDRMEVMDVKTGDNFEIYFNVDIPFTWLNKRLQR